MRPVSDMTIEERDAEVELLLRLGEGFTGVEKRCPMCAARFAPRALDDVRWDDFHVNACSPACQEQYNRRIVELDGGRSITLIGAEARPRSGTSGWPCCG